MSQGQRAIWEASYQAFISSDEAFDEAPSDFAIEIAALLRPAERVLELGCGTGRDAAHLALAGHETLAIDHSATAIEIASRQFDELVASGRLRFTSLDIAQHLPAANAAFDAVYARLSLHYFSDDVTKKVFGEIARVLKTGGLLAFVCKSVDDPDYGRGRRIAEHVFESHHIRHFFSEAYALECISPNFRLLKSEHVHAPLYGRDSAYVKVLARRS